MIGKAMGIVALKERTSHRMERNPLVFKKRFFDVSCRPAVFMMKVLSKRSENPLFHRNAVYFA